MSIDPYADTDAGGLACLQPGPHHQLQEGILRRILIYILRTLTGTEDSMILNLNIMCRMLLS